MKDIYQAAHAILLVLSTLCRFSAILDLFFLAWDGTGWYEDPVRDWSATIAALVLGYMLMSLSLLFYTEEK